MILTNYLHTLISYFRRPEKRKLIKLASGLKSKKALEIGGPSKFFSTGSHFPVYLFAETVDVANYSSETVWEGTIKEGKNYNYFEDKTGYQFISEATDLSNIANEVYDIVLSCHSLEHVANPLKALLEWKRVLKKDGKLLIVLPYKETTFDRQRPFTTFEHVLADYNNGIDESDSTHFEEILKLHDHSMDTGTETKEAFKERLLQNEVNRCAHHHVFDTALIKQMVEWAGFKVKHQQIAYNFHLITYAEL